MRVLAHEERAGDALVASVVTDGLRDGEDVRLGERAAKRRAAVSAGTEADELIWAAQVRNSLIVLAFQSNHIDQEVRGSRFASHWMKRHESSRVSIEPRPDVVPEPDHGRLVRCSGPVKTCAKVRPRRCSQDDEITWLDWARLEENRSARARATQGPSRFRGR